MTNLSRRTVLSGAGCAALSVFFDFPTSRAYLLVREGGTLEDALRASKRVTLENSPVGRYVAKVDNMEISIHDRSRGFVIRHDGVFVPARLDEWSVRAGDTISIAIERVA